MFVTIFWGVISGLLIGTVWDLIRANKKLNPNFLFRIAGLIIAVLVMLNVWEHFDPNGKFALYLIVSLIGSFCSPLISSHIRQRR